ncbi:MAG: hypothetical protein PF904_11375 [Kiritimatiellae bacterium]|jgi:hypothetical protein|nr:hypothetical protein [Kiritimatiellia bacterium]
MRLVASDELGNKLGSQLGNELGNYVVVIHITNKNEGKANHVTAYVADPSTIAKINRAPVWA